jgi:16S rRNA (guanine527-N7)-methyltransferase
VIDTQLLATGARELGVDLAADQLDRFARFAELLIDWNGRFNLTSIVEPRDIVIKHFLDSLSVLTVLPPTAKYVIDVGTGAGLPGLAIKIARPDISLTLLEATRKKCNFLEALVTELDLGAVLVWNARAEEAAHDPAHRESYDVAVARAVAEMPTLLEYVLPFVKVGGVAIAQKSKGGDREVQRAGAAIAILGGRLQPIVPIELAGLDEPRYLAVVEKIDRTPEKYPRRAGVPSKKPIGNRAE